MKAIQYRERGKGPELVEIPNPTPSPGQVLLKITAAGLCHSDVHVMSMPPEALGITLPLTLGHECVGIVVDAGEGAADMVEEGEAVLVYGPWGCGRCRNCAEGYENYCLNAQKLGIQPPGLGKPGGAAEYMVVDRARHLVPIGDLDPVKTAPLTDAALTPYHAIRHSQPKLSANSFAIVQGVGGLGHTAIQILKHLTAAQVIAIDVKPDALDLAKRVGADYTFAAGPKAVEAVRDLTGGKGAEVVFDFVGIQPTIDLGAQLLSVMGDWNIVGLGGGVAKAGFGVIPYECQVFSPYWGTRADMYDVVSLAQRGIIDIHVETFPLEQGVEAYRRLEQGKILGRAVLVP